MPSTGRRDRADQPVRGSEIQARNGSVPQPATPPHARRIGAAVLCAVFLALVLPSAPAPAATADATIPHAGATGSWLFVPGTSELRPAVPRQTPAGAGWSTTGPTTGTVPAGTWTLAAGLSTSVASGTAQGQVVAAVYAVGPDGARLLGMPATGDVLATGTSQDIALALTLDEVVLRDESVVVEWYLTVSRHQVLDSDAVTTLTAGTDGDAVSLPGAPTPLPLVGPTRAAVTDPQDHRLTVTWRASSDDRVVAYDVQGGPSADAMTTLGTVAAGAGGPYAFVVPDLVNREPVFLAVVGRDGEGRATPMSNVTQGRALDRTPPDAPGAPSVVPAGTGVLELGWPASDAEDLTGYEVERAATPTGPFVTVARGLTALTFADQQLPPQTTWWYRVRSVDDDGLRSAASETASTTTAPAVPTGVRIAATGDGVLTVTWDGTNRPLAGYRVERASGTGGFAAVGGLVTGTGLTQTGLSNGTTYRYRVAAEDRRGIRSDWSAVATGSPRPTAAPAPPTFLTLDDVAGGVALAWGRSPTAGVVGYRVLRSTSGGPASELGGLRTDLAYTDRDVRTGTRYEYTVVAVDGSGRRSAPTTAMTWVVQPSAPSGLTVSPAGSSTVALAWSPSDDASATYEVFRAEGTADAALVARTDRTSFEDGGLLLETTYAYFVRAVSAGFRASPASNRVDVTLRDGPPAAPVATATDATTGGAIEVRWEPPAERDVTSWRIERREAGEARWEQVAPAVPQPLRSHLDDGLTDGVRYEYRLIAIDRGGAESPPSAVTSAVPSDTTPPPTLGPPSVRLTVGALAVDWEVAATAVRYEVLRSGSPEGPYERIATTSLRTIRDPDVRPGQTYHYRVVAFDAAGNASAPSEVGTGTFRTSVSPGAVVPVLPGAGGAGTGGVGGETRLPPTSPSSPFDPTRPVLPPGLGGPVDVGVGAGAGSVPDVPPRTPAVEDRSVLAFPPDLGGLRDAVSAGDLPGAVGRVIGEVAGNVPDVARAFSIPLLLVVVILLYLMAQGRIDRDAALLTVDAPAGGDEDDAEFLL